MLNPVCLVGRWVPDLRRSFVLVAWHLDFLPAPPRSGTLPRHLTVDRMVLTCFSASASSLLMSAFWSVSTFCIAVSSTA